MVGSHTFPPPRKEPKMTPLRQRMLEDMQIRNLAPSTQETYVRHVAGLAHYFGKSPEHMGPREIRDYQVYLLKEKQLSPNTLIGIVAALRFLYGTTLKRSWSVEAIPAPRRIKKLPAVLSREEVAKFLGATKNLKHRALMMTIYGCGLRSAEATHLRVQDIDSQSMLLRVAFGKGAKDRFVPLCPQLLKVLRQYWKEYRPEHWLFPGHDPRRPLLEASARQAVCKIKRNLQLKKNVTLHGLRHSYATHLLEDGVEIRTIQLLLGHRSLNSTSRYTHISANKLHEAKSPLDKLPDVSS